MKKIFAFLSLCILLTGCSKELTIQDPDFVEVKLKLSIKVQDVGPLKGAEVNQYIPIEFDYITIELYEGEELVSSVFDATQGKSMFLPLGTFTVKLSPANSVIVSSDKCFIDNQDVEGSITITAETTEVAFTIIPGCSLFYSEISFGTLHQLTDTGNPFNGPVASVDYQKEDSTTGTVYYIYIKCNNTESYISHNLQFNIDGTSHVVYLKGKYENGRSFYLSDEIVVNLDVNFESGNL
jgi:hypothetical protein